MLSLLVDILGQARRGDDSLELGAHQAGARLVEALPAAERRHQPGSDARVQFFGGEDHVGDKSVTAPRRVVERPLVNREIPDQRAQAVGVGEGERGVAGEALDLVDGLAPLRRRLQREPFVDHQRIVLETIVEGAERGLALRLVERRQDRERALAIGHVVGRVELRLGELGAALWIARRKQAERHALEPAGALGRNAEIVADRLRRMGPDQLAA